MMTDLGNKSPSRGEIIAMRKKANANKSALTGEFDRAKREMHPRTIAQRWRDEIMRAKNHQQQRAIASGRKLVQKNAIPITIIGISTLIIVARKPILKIPILLRELRKKVHINSKDHRHE